MIEATFKLKNAKKIITTADMCNNVHLVKKVNWRCDIVHLSKQKEKEWKQIFKPALLTKLRLSKNFLQNVLHSRKTALGVGLLALRIIIDVLALKLHFRHKRINSKVAKVIQINENNTWFECGCSKSCLEINRNAKLNKIMGTDEVWQKLSRRNLVVVNQIEEPK